jgi:phospholipase C
MFLTVMLACLGWSAPVTEDVAVSSSLRVATYNVKMLPAGLGFFNEKTQAGQQLRVPWVIDYLNEQAFDVVVLQELFDPAITARIKAAIEETYPYQVGPQAGGGSIRGTDGLLIASRFPLEQLGHIVFEAIKPAEKLASKGCTLVALEKAGTRYQIAGTHMLTGKDPVKMVNFTRIREELLEKHAEPCVPQVLLGDMNVTKGTALYADMMERLKMEDFALEDPLPHTAGDPANYWNKKKNREEGHQLDYILLDAGGGDWGLKEVRVLRPTRLHEGEEKDLSDHYGVSAVLRRGSK